MPLLRPRLTPHAPRLTPQAPRFAPHATLTLPHSTFRGLDVAVKTMILRDDADKQEAVDDFKLEVGMTAS